MSAISTREGNQDPFKWQIWVDPTPVLAFLLISGCCVVGVGAGDSNGIKFLSAAAAILFAFLTGVLLKTESGQCANNALAQCLQVASEIGFPMNPWTTLDLARKRSAGQVFKHFVELLPESFADKKESYFASAGNWDRQVACQRFVAHLHKHPELFRSPEQPAT